jgi:hypothetical protein
MYDKTTSIDFFIGGFLPNFNLKNIIPTYVKDFLWQKWPKLPNSIKFFLIYKDHFIIFLYMVYNQI